MANRFPLKLTNIGKFLENFNILLCLNQRILFRKSLAWKKYCVIILFIVYNILTFII